MNINHIGYVVVDIARYAETLPGLKKLRQVHDPIQHATLALYSCGGLSQIELIQPDNEEAFTWGHLQRHGEGLHHICYEGLDQDGVTKTLAQYKMLRIRGPIYAPLFNRQVIFAVTQQRAIVEFLL